MNKTKIKIREYKTQIKKADELFNKIQHLPWAILLDTCESEHSEGRFDILAYQPIATYEYLSGESSFSVNAKSLDFSSLDRLQKLSKDPFTILSNIDLEYKQQVSLDEDSHLPFINGWLGAFSYDLNVYTDKIKQSDVREYNLPEIAFGLYTNVLIVDRLNNKVYYCYLEDDPQWLQAFEAERDNDENFALKEAWQSNVDVKRYLANFDKIQEYLRAGDCYQVNYAQRFSAPYEGCEWQAYRQLRQINKAPFSAFIRLQEGCILSVSPERFLQVKNNKVETKPIKGTRKRHLDAVEDERLAQELLSAEKDKAENLMIVDLLRNDLSKHCKPCSVKVPKLFDLESYPAVHHLVSTVVGELRENTHPFLLIQGAFPGGSITGAPKVRAMQIIDELEPNKRSIYCGSVGYLGIQNDMDTSICIRTILAENNMMYCWAGGGIVLDSKGEDEYQESLDKVAKILPVLSEHLSD